MNSEERIKQIIHDTFENPQLDGWMISIFENIDLYNKTKVVSYRAKMKVEASYILAQIKSGYHLGLYSEQKMFEYIDLLKEAVSNAFTE